MRRCLVPLLTLAACQNQPAQTGNASQAQNQADAPVKDIDALPADETAAAAVGANDGAPALAPATAQPPLPTNIPEPFWGRWGLAPADCSETGGGAKGLLRIDDNRLYFSDGKATLARIIAATPTRVEAEYGFGGEDREWTEVQVLERSGDTLRRSGRGNRPVDLTYRRCA